MAVAPRIAAHMQRMGNTPGPWGPASPGMGGRQLAGGVPFLDQVPTFAAMHPNARLIVEWAPTAEQVTDVEGALWQWVDITTDVLQADGKVISISPLGRSDASTTSQPAGCSFTVKNIRGDYSKGPRSRNYPNLRPNIPVRVMVSLTGERADRYGLFVGFTSSVTPSWDATGSYAIAEFRCSGTTRRLQQRSTPLKSSLYRANTRISPAPIAYWPMEEVAGATSFASGLSNGLPMSMDGAWTLANYTAIIGSDALPTMTATSDFKGTVSGTQDQHWQVDCMFNMPTAPAVNTRIISVGVKNSTTARWDLNVPGGSTTQIRLDITGPTGAILASNTYAVPVAGAGPRNIRLTTKQNGANIDWTVIVFNTTLPLSGLAPTGSLAGTWGPATYIAGQTGGAVGLDGTSIGQIQVWNAYDHVQLDGPMYGWEGETAGARLTRLCDEESIGLTWIGDTPDTMGPQTRDSLMNLLREAEATDMGVLNDGIISAGALLYRSRDARLNRETALTLDISASEIVPPFGPVDDDQLLTNVATVARKGGSSATFEDRDGPLGTQVIGDYADSRTVNPRFDDLQPGLGNYAGWVVRSGEPSGYRYPTVELDMRRVPGVAQAMLALVPSDRITVTNIETWLSQHPAGDIDLTVEGSSTQISRFIWAVTLNCSPGELVRTGQWATATGSGTSEFDAIYDNEPGTCVLSANITPGDQAATIFTTVGATAPPAPIWTTNNEDMPVELSIGGYQVTALVIAGATGAQSIICMPVNVPLDNQLLGTMSTFEDGLGTWCPNVNSLVTVTSAQSKSGTYSMQLTSTGGGNTAAQHHPSTTVGAFPILPNQLYEFAGWMRAATIPRTCALQLNWFDANGIYLTTTTDSTFTSSTTTWTGSITRHFSPGNAVWAQAIPQFAGAAGAGEVHYVDNLIFSIYDPPDDADTIPAGAAVSLWKPTYLAL